MRKFTAIILCTAFIIAQYVKQVSYLECRLTNFFNITVEKCDCEQLLGESENPNNESSIPAKHNHVYIDESYCPSLPTIYRVPGRDNQTGWSMTGSILIEGSYSNIDHPPQYD